MARRALHDKNPRATRPTAHSGVLMSETTGDTLHHHYRCTLCKCAFEHTVLRARFLDDVPQCPKCNSEKLVRTVPVDVANPDFVKLAGQVSRYRGRTNVECNTLPLHYPGADSYSPLGKPRFNTLNKLKEAGKRFGLAWA